MRLTISRKLTLSFLGLTLTVLIATLGLARWSFERGFFDYANALEQHRLQSLAASLSREYVSDGDSWSALTAQRFNQVLRRSQPEGAGLDRGRPPGPRPPGPMHPPPGAYPPTPPTLLLDSHGETVAGSPLPEIKGAPISVPVLVAGQQVGELRSTPRRRFDSPQETAFSSQQLYTSLIIGVVSLVLATIVALVLTRILLAPIRRLLSGVSQISSGDYSSRINESRDDELGQLMADLDRLAHKLEENRDARQRWMADISHELRTPVTVLTGELEALKDGILPLEMPQVLSLDQEVARLRHLIEDLFQLSLSDIGGLRYSMSPIDLLDSLDAVVGRTKKRALDAGIEIALHGNNGININGDAQRLDQLFSNLIENALAYTDAPGRMDISLSQSAGLVSIRIEDTPPGIDVEDCERLFEPLFRQDASRSRRTAGAGLGLAICRNIVAAHQGSINASPSELGGLCIHIIFPSAIE